MENLVIAGGEKTPSFLFDAQKGLIEIIGRSWPEHALQVYAPVFKWVEEYCLNPAPKTIINLKMEYFNTSSLKVVLDVLKKLDQLTVKGNQAEINWYYEFDDPDLKEQGYMVKNVLKTPVNLIEVEEF
ncbi:MAG: DUF1987 domain-containing protein [Bacteroidia bacterium]|nr:DUF1987 domain-containing protein [Bacteroidia bacterium]